MLKWFKRIVFLLAMILVIVFSVGYFLIDSSEWELAASIISAVVAVLSVVNTVLYFKSCGEGSTLVTVLLVLEFALAIVGTITGNGLLALGFIGLVLALWVHLGNALFSFLKNLGSTLDGK